MVKKKKHVAVHHGILFMGNFKYRVDIVDEVDEALDVVKDKSNY